jgi:hypothetical protein
VDGVPFKREGALKLITNSGKIWVFMWVLHKIYFLGDVRLSIPESNSSELGRHWSEPGCTTSDFPRIRRQSNKCRRPSLSTLNFFTL